MPAMTRRRLAMMTMSTALTITLAAAPAATADVDPHPGMLRNPDVSKDHIVFVYANDLWIVARDGGVATQLASPPGGEGFPKFSPDGKTVAFMGNYEGGRDLYTIGIDGGTATRVTHHPTGETLCDWVGDDQLLFYARGIEGHPRGSQLFTVSAEGGMPEKLPVPYGTVASISADGKWLAYTPHTRDTRTWKRHRGGMATDIWLFNLETHESRQITDWEGTDTLPMWHGDTLYYLSDGGPAHRTNIWSYNPRTNRRTQITDFTDNDVKWPSMGPAGGAGEIVFQAGSSLYLVNLRSRATREVEVTIPGDRPTLRPRTVDVKNYVQGGNISATGKRVVFSARGDIWTAPAEKGVPRNLTRTSGVAERDPAWSPDGKWIAYFSDATDEYELYITQSDGKGETRQLTDGNGPFKFTPVWSPDSEKIAFYDRTGTLFICTVEDGSLVSAFTDPMANQPPISWSHDSNWIAYAKANGMMGSSIWLHDVATGENHQVTSGMFADGSPAFDRKGEYLYYTSARNFSPTYSSIDLSFIYNDSQVLVAVPLRDDVEDPWALEIDEEEWKEDEEDNEEESGDDEEASDEAEGDEAAGSDDAGDAADDGGAPAHPLHGTWTGTLTGLAAMGAPMDTADFSMTLVVADDGSISGSMSVMGDPSQFSSVTFDEGTGAFTATTDADGMTAILRGTLQGESMSGEWEVVEAGATGGWSASRESQEADSSDVEAGDDDSSDAASDEPLIIDLDGFEARGMQLPGPAGTIRQTAVNNKNQLLYVRMSPGTPGIKLIDISEDNPSEKNVASGAGGFSLSGDGKKLAILRGASATIQNASAGASGKPVVSSPMNATINPREEWRQIFNDTWRIFRDFFYVKNMHGVDWPAMREHYAAMIDDCVNREDLNFVIGELISELNVGHAYRGGGDTEGQPNRSIGMLGVDWELHEGAYRIKAFQHGAPWDTDARNPLMRPGLDLEVGTYVHAVNGLPIDTSIDPWAAFADTANRPTVLTVSDSPELDDTAREVVVRPTGSENSLRYRAWIEANRAYVDKMSGGRLGYIYVPNTGVDGQNDLFRQFYGQINKEGLIIDERWNGGGQIPTRFIELMNRPRTNYWAVGEGGDWVWPPDSHQGPKCMLINGLAGSGGDMFPWLFKQAGLGKLIGTRTWGGLVGISGNPPLIDNGFIRVPTFGFYEKDGTWGIEGHGTDPDIEVIDDPALMVNGGDPQLDAAIEHMMVEIERNGYKPPKRPADPDRSGMGVTEEDK